MRIAPLLAAAILLSPTAARGGAGGAAGAGASLGPARVPAAGSQAALLRVDTPGRYAITVSSAAGTALQLVDRIAGPGRLAGAAGERDGRVDELLDRGVYRLVTFGDERAPGEAALELRAFRELSAPRPPLLVEEKPVASALGDFEQRSWWLRVETPRRVVLEAAGRNLSDLRLFRDGGWLVDAPAVRATVEPEAGRPLRSARVAARLEPGLYLLTAFGGPDEPWPAGGDAHPLHLRWGIPRLGDAGRTRYRVGPFGADAFVLPGTVTFVQLELAEAGEALLAAASPAAEGDPFAAEWREAPITKKHREPVATLSLRPDPRGHLVLVRAPAGTPYVLQHFEERSRYTFPSSGTYWLSSVHSGHPQDSADATAIVTPAGAPGRVEPVLSQAVEVGPGRGWARRCNLLRPLTVFFRVRETGKYEVLLRGTAARARFEPFLVSRPRGYREPPLQGGGATWDLDAGWHVLTVVPEEPGIVEAAVRPAGALDAVWDLLDPGRPLRGEPVRPAVTFPEVNLTWNQAYTVWLNDRPGVRSGIVLRPLPVDLAQPLPVALVPGEEIEFAARLPEPGTVRAETEAGEALEVRVGPGAWTKAAEAFAGELRVAVRNDGKESVLAAVRLEPARLGAEAPLPELAADELPPLPQFTRLDEEATRFLDLAPRGEAVFALDVAQPGFHVAESTGLLATEGALRSRFLPRLAADAGGGGTGRNFLVAAYLREGSYQLSLKLLGQSAGHLGVRLRRSALRDGGELREGASSRIFAAAGEGVLHAFEIATAGDYELTALGAGRPLPCRLEDAEGWPIEPPGTPTPIRRRFEPGRYRVLLAPAAVAARRVTLLERVVEPPRFEGHGPHPLALDRAAAHLWLEPASGAPRTPDLWEFSLPAPATVTVALTGEMQGTIARRGDAPGAAPLVQVAPGAGWTGELAAGEYTLAAACSRRNNRVDYEVSVRPVELVAGLSRPLEAPATVPLSVGAAGLYEIATAGAPDVRARLLDEGGAVVAEQEDRPDDWNVQLSARLAPGRYRLEVTPTGADAAATRVAVRAIPERVEPPLLLPARLELSPGDAVVTLPLALPGGERLLVVRARAGETVGLAIDRARADGGWETLWSGLGDAPAVEVPVSVDAAARRAGVRARVWSLDRRGGAIALAAAALAPARLAEGDLRTGAAVAASADLDPPLAVAEVALERPGLLRLDAASPAWRASGALHRPLADAGGALVAATGSRLWLAADARPGSRGPLVRGERRALAPGEPLTVDLPADGSPVVCDVEPRGAGPVLVAAQAAAGRPGVALVPRERDGQDAAARAPSAQATAVVGERAASALLPAAAPAAALLWRADPRLPAAQATLRLFSFPGADEGALPAGVGGGALEPLGARLLALPRGDKRLRLALGPGVAAALVRDGAVESAHDAGAGTLDETVETAAERLLVVNAGAVPAQWSAELTPIEGRARTGTLAADRPLLANFTAAGTLRVPVAREENRDGKRETTRLLVALNGEATLLGADGRIVSGSAIPAGAGGRLLLRHGTGLAGAWLEPGADGAPGPWGGGAPRRSRALRPPELVRLEGPSVALALELDRAAVLHLRTQELLAGAVVRPATPAAALLFDGGNERDVVLAPGQNAIWLRPALGGELRGELETLLSPVAPLGEGPGPEVLVPPGAARWFAFTVAREGPVGIGVRSVPDTATATVFDAAGSVGLGSGIVQLLRLEPGGYLLAVRAPAGGGPVLVRPALAGLVPPQEGPPQEVIRRYLELGRGGEETDAATPEPGAGVPEGDRSEGE